MTAFAQDIRATRKRAGLTQEQAAEILKVSKRTLEHWEANERLPDASEYPSILKKLAELIPEGAKPSPPQPEKLAHSHVPPPQDSHTPINRDPNAKGITDSPRSIALAAEWAKRSNIYPPNPLPYGLSPSELLEAHRRGEPGITITQRRHAQQWQEILGG